MAALLCVHSVLAEDFDVEKIKRDIERSHELNVREDKGSQKRLKLLEKIVKAFPEEPGPWLALAGLEQRMGQRTDAEKHFIQALTVAKDWLGPARGYAVFLQDIGRDGDAEALVRTSLSYHPSDTSLRSLLAECLNRSDPLTARSLWDSIAKEDPSRYDAMLKAASVEFSRRDWQAAATRFDRMHRLRPEDREVLALWADACRMAGRDRDAANLKRELALKSGDCASLSDWVEAVSRVEKTAKILDYCQSALNVNKGCSVLWMKKAELLEELGRKAEAADAYAQAWAMDPGNPFLRSRMDSISKELGRSKPSPIKSMTDRERIILFRRVESDLTQDRWKEAFRRVKKAPFQNESDFEALYLRKMVLLGKGDPDLSQWIVRLRAVFVKPGSVLHACALRGTGNRLAANEGLKQVLRRFPGDADLWVLAGQWYEEDGSYLDAVKYYAEANKRDWREPGWGDQGRCYLRSGNLEKAEKCFREERLRRPDNPDAVRGLHDLYQRQGRYLDAGQMARLWQKLDPLSAEAWKTNASLSDLSSAERKTSEQILKILR